MNPTPDALEAAAEQLTQAARRVRDLASICHFDINNVMSGGRLTADVGAVLDDQQRRWSRLADQLTSAASRCRARARRQRLAELPDPFLDADVLF